MSPHHENSGEATYENKYQLNIKNLKLPLKLCNITGELNLRGKQSELLHGQAFPPGGMKCFGTTGAVCTHTVNAFNTT